MKHKAFTSDGWQWTAKEHPDFTLRDIIDNDFVILVNITEPPNQPDDFILKRREAEEILQKGFERWVKEPSKRDINISYGADNKHRLLMYNDYKDLLEKRKDPDILWQ